MHTPKRKRTYKQKWNEMKRKEKNKSNHVNSKQQHILCNKQTFYFPLFFFIHTNSHSYFIFLMCIDRIWTDIETERKRERMTDNRQTCTIHKKKRTKIPKWNNDNNKFICGAHTFVVQYERMNENTLWIAENDNSKPITKDHILIILCAFQLSLLLESNTNWQWCAWNIYAKP